MKTLLSRARRRRCCARNRRALAERAAPTRRRLKACSSLTASASVEVTKDLLAVTFSTTREGADANAVQAQLKQALDAALAEAKKAARPGQVDVQTGTFSLYPALRDAPTQGGHHRLAGQRRGHRRRPRHGGDRPAHRSHHDDDDRAGRLPAVARGEPEGRGRGRRRGDRPRSAPRPASYAKQFGYGGYAMREVNVDDDRAAAGAGADDAGAGIGDVGAGRRACRSSPARRRSPRPSAARCR